VLQQEAEVDLADTFKPPVIPAPISWKAALLRSESLEALSFLQDLLDFTGASDHKDPPAPPFPQTLALLGLPRVRQTRNFAPAKSKELQAKGLKLKSALVVVDWLPDPQLHPEQRLFAALSLAEAEALRAVLLAQPAAFGPAALALILVKSDKVLACTPAYRSSILAATRPSNLKRDKDGRSDKDGGLSGPSLPACLEAIGVLSPSEGDLFPGRRPSSSPGEAMVAQRTQALARNALLVASGTAGASLRFFNNDMFLSEVENMLFLRALNADADAFNHSSDNADATASHQNGSLEARRQFFRDVLKARRKWNSDGMIDHATVRWLFTYRNERELADVIKLRHSLLKIIREKKLVLLTEFRNADKSGDGAISLPELEQYMYDDMRIPEDAVPRPKVKDLLVYMDIDGNGSIDKHEFVSMFTTTKDSN